MIKVGVIGASTTDAGELMRILINHPEVDIRSLYAPTFAGRPVTSRHHGFIGEKIVNFSDTIDPKELDVVFIVENLQGSKDNNTDISQISGTKVIDLSHANLNSARYPEIVCGISEINRKTLVRGVEKAYIPSSLTSLALITLGPLGQYLKLPDEINIEVAAPTDVVNNVDENSVVEELKSELNKIQKSFSGVINLRFTPNKSRRVMRARIRFKSNLSVEEVDNIYQSIYDDHNFVFTSFGEVEGKEIEGTHKTVISFQKLDPETLELEIVGDCRLRGGAGDAVHVLNLLFSLYEKIGLQLKPSRFGENRESTSRPPSWFG